MDMLATLTEWQQKLPINGFDVALLAILGFGLFRGRKNGMSKEVLPTIEWLVMVGVCGFGYGMVAPFYKNSWGLSGLLAAILGYATFAFLVLMLFAGLKNMLGQRLATSNFFGSSEYFLGMPSGMIRYSCVLLFALAFLNARTYTVAEVKQRQAYNQRWYGGGIFSGDYVPDWHAAQEYVFTDSFSGPYIKNYLSMLLIQTQPENPGLAKPVVKKTPIIHIGN